MALRSFELIDGLQVGEFKHKTVLLKALTAGDLEDAAIEAERVINLDGSPAIATSPVIMANEVLVRQIERIGEISPVTRNMLRSLSAADLELIQAEVQIIDAATRKTVEAMLMRGRFDEPSAGDDSAFATAQQTNALDSF